MKAVGNEDVQGPGPLDSLQEEVIEPGTCK
jgi:hypothetical protein